MNQFVLLGRKSWTAYVGTVLRHLAAAAVAGFLFSVLLPGWTLLAVLAVLGVAVYRVAVIRSWRLFANQEGVWMSSGILPWTRALAGVKWRDIDAASYVNGFSNWLFRSYELRVTHRFTKSGEIRFTHLHDGKRVAALVHTRHAALVTGFTAGPDLVESPCLWIAPG